MFVLRDACQYMLILSVIFEYCTLIQCGRGHSRELCERDEFTCFSGGCIDSSLLCDGIAHCYDSSDECTKVCSNNWCPSFMFRCYYGACVPISSICDGMFDCHDKSDEPPHNSCKLPSSFSNTFAVISTTKSYTPFVPGGWTETPNVIRTTTKRFTPFEPIGWTDATTKPPRTKSTTIRTPSTSAATTSSTPAGQCRLPEETVERTYSINECTKNSTDSSCRSTKGDPVPSGTVLYFKCEHPKYTYESDIFTAYCLEGEWTPQIESCKTCGILPPKGKGVENIPWQVAIYEKSTDRPVCWGSVVSPYLVISAAHCFYDESLNWKKDISTFYATIGKFDGKPANRAQLFNITSVRFSQDGFQGRVTNYAADIAVVEISPTLNFNSERNQVCMELTDSLLINEKRTGWLSLYKSAGQNSFLETETVPYSNFEDCVGTLSDSFKQLVTSDKICVLDKTIDKGNAGKGLYIKRDGESVHRLRGVLSTTFVDSSTNKHIVMVTDVTKHLLWLNEMIDEMNQRRRTSETIDIRFPKNKS